MGHWCGNGLEARQVNIQETERVWREILLPYVYRVSIPWRIQEALNMHPKAYALASVCSNCCSFSYSKSKNNFKNKCKGEERSGEEEELRNLYAHTYVHIKLYQDRTNQPDQNRPLPAKHPQGHLCRINPWLPRSVHNWTIGTGTAKKRWLRFQIVTVWSGWIFWRHVVTGSQLCTWKVAFKFACECSIQTSSKGDAVSYECLFSLSGFPYKMRSQWTREIFAMSQKKSLSWLKNVSDKILEQNHSSCDFVTAAVAFV